MHAGWHSDVDRWNGNLYGGGHASLVIESDLSPSPTSTISNIWYQPDIASRPWRMAASIIINCKAETTGSLSYCIYSSQQQRINSLTNNSLAVINPSVFADVPWKNNGSSNVTLITQLTRATRSIILWTSYKMEFNVHGSLQYWRVQYVQDHEAEFICARMHVGGTKCGCVKCTVLLWVCRLLCKLTKPPKTRLTMLSDGRTDGQTDGRGSTLNAAPREGCTFAHVPILSEHERKVCEECTVTDRQCHKTKYFRWWNKCMYELGRCSFRSWFDLNQSTFDKDRLRAKNDFTSAFPVTLTSDLLILDYTAIH